MLQKGQIYSIVCNKRSIQNNPVWKKQIPTKSGWYWIKYKGKHGTVVCPAEVSFLNDTTHVRSARNDSFMEGPNHGGPGLKYHGKVDKSIRFANKIKQPSE